MQFPHALSVYRKTQLQFEMVITNNAGVVILLRTLATGSGYNN